jgi:hypothetical protein
MKDNNIKFLMIAGALAAAFLAPTLGRTVPELISFSSGDPVSATDFNSNFDALHQALSSVETKVATLEAELATARASAGSVTNAAGQSFEVFRKVLTGTKTTTTTTAPLDPAHFGIRANDSEREVHAGRPPSHVLLYARANHGQVLRVDPLSPALDGAGGGRAAPRSAR